MDKKVVCNCPKCNKDLTEGRFAYECECGFKCSKEIWGVPVSEELMKEIANGGITDVFTFKKPDKEWSARLKYSQDEGKVVFVFDNKPRQEYPQRPKAEVIGKCPCCNGDIKSTERFYICENYKKEENPCELIIGKDFSGQTLSKEEAIKLLNGETLPAKEYTWRSGKKGFAKLKLNEHGKTEFVFE